MEMSIDVIVIMSHQKPATLTQRLQHIEQYSLSHCLLSSGWLAFYEGGKRPAPPQYQESHPSVATQQLWAQLLAPQTVWWGAWPAHTKATSCHCSTFSWWFSLPLPCFHRTIFPLQKFPSGPTTGSWSGYAPPIWPNTLPTWEAAVCTEAWWWGGVLFVQWEIRNELVGAYQLKSVCVFSRCWSQGLTWRLWHCCWTSPPTRRYCVATWPHISTCSLVLKPNISNRSVWKTQTTLYWPPPTRSRWDHIELSTPTWHLFGWMMDNFLH